MATCVRPTACEVDASLTLTDIAGSERTVSVAEDVLPEVDAEITEKPGLRVVTWPELVIVAMEVSELVQATVRESVRPLASRTVALNVSFSPTFNVTEVGESTIEDTVDLTTVAAAKAV